MKKFFHLRTTHQILIGLVIALFSFTSVAYGQTINTTNTSVNPCLSTDCVFPGDADKNGKADLYDLMSIGMGFGKTGPERVNATPMEWVGQMALDWEESTASGVNYKHFDSDGNGIIDYQDITPIIHHYSPMEKGVDYTSSTGPRISLDFEVDTIFINEDTENIVTLNAGIVVGSADVPMEDIYGMALFLDYDSTLTEATEGVMINYNDNCFIGGQNEVIAYDQDLRSNQQADFAITRLNSQVVSGYGRVATVSFSIIIDVIDGRSERTIPFSVPIFGAKVINQQGNIVPISLDIKPAKVIFINENKPTSVIDNSLANQVSVFPNPATENINIELTDLIGEQVNIFNSLGQKVATHKLDQTSTSIPVNNLSPGIYILNIQTDKGLANKRVVVE